MNPEEGVRRRGVAEKKRGNHSQMFCDFLCAFQWNDVSECG